MISFSLSAQLSTISELYGTTKCKESCTVDYMHTYTQTVRTTVTHINKYIITFIGHCTTSLRIQPTASRFTSLHHFNLIFSKQPVIHSISSLVSNLWHTVLAFLDKITTIPTR